MASNPAKEHRNLTRRERQIMDILYAREEATVQEILEALIDSPHYSTVRALVNKLVDKGQVVYRQEGPRYVYRPALQKAVATDNAVKRLLDTFFAGSPRDAVVNLLGGSNRELSEADIAEIERVLAEVKAQQADRRNFGEERD